MYSDVRIYIGTNKVINVLTRKVAHIFAARTSCLNVRDWLFKPTIQTLSQNSWRLIFHIFDI